MNTNLNKKIRKFAKRIFADKSRFKIDGEEEEKEALDYFVEKFINAVVNEKKLIPYPDSEEDRIKLIGAKFIIETDEGLFRIKEYMEKFDPEFFNKYRILIEGFGENKETEE